MRLSSLLFQLLLHTFAQKREAVYAMGQMLSASMILSLGFSDISTLIPHISYLILFLSLVFGSHTLTFLSWRQDIEHGYLYLWRQTGYRIDSIVAIRFLSLFTVLMILTVFLIMLVITVQGDISHMARYSLVFMNIVACMTAMGLTAGALSAGHHNPSLLGQIILMPFYVPIYIFGYQAVQDDFFWSVSMLILQALALALVPVFIYLNAMILHWQD